MDCPVCVQRGFKTTATRLRWPAGPPGAPRSLPLVAALAGRVLPLPARDDRRLAHSLRLAATPALCPLRGIAGHGLRQGHAEAQVADRDAHAALQVFEFDAHGARPALIA